MPKWTGKPPKTSRGKHAEKRLSLKRPRKRANPKRERVYRRGPDGKWGWFPVEA